MKNNEVEIKNTTDPGIFKTDFEKNLYKKIGEIKKYYSSIKSDATLEPGSSTKFKIVLTLDEKSDVAYRTYEVKWESFK